MLAKDQVDLLYHPTLPTAEAASIFSEMLLTAHFLEEADEEEKISILTYLLTSQYGGIVRQAFFTEFEKKAHNSIQEGATSEQLDQLWMKTLEDQLGDMEIPEIFKHEWARIPHFFRTPFYCYAYSWGNLFTLSLFDMYREEGEDFKDKYVNMLKQGGGKSPTDLMREMGIDPSKEEFWQRGFDVIRDELEELKELI